MPRTIILTACAVLGLLAACEAQGEGEWIAPGGSRTVNGVRMGEIPLAQVVPAVAASDVEQGHCDVSRRQPNGSGFVQMSWPAAQGEIRQAMVTLGAAGQLMNYGEMRKTADAMTSVMIDISTGTGGATNVTDGGARMTIGRGTADEALQSEALGVPARRVARILERCGRPGEKS